LGWAAPFFVVAWFGARKPASCCGGDAATVCTGFGCKNFGLNLIGAAWNRGAGATTFACRQPRPTAGKLILW
jgi:hypothetical protein